ncbi:hypothetical protein GCM10011507_21120 [Edaphobacter acidisoli]|uniref:DUF1634 domain-containing protein n=1 Tax=Edaphobacter acidisoli TaxID=2040573 RepID=A0A916W689_9BACT|nr:DUF1634 domain-containing protein [Edaphobacter acidisoli]GGA69399.1 hypothetical protein GCM10011507_21120 [Edaphobacter acidisoli]
MTGQRKFDDQRMEYIMGRLLQAGVMLASVVVLVGGILYVRDHAAAPMNYRIFVSEPAFLRHPGQLFRHLAAGDGAAIVQFGILLLIATPIARVVFAVIGFAIEHDRLYVAVSVFVLMVLMVSLLYLS